MIIRRGKNLPIMQVLINGAGGKSHENILQILGRLLRKGEGQEKVYLDDFFDKGYYLQKHSKRRIIFYRNEKFEVKEIYKIK
jgi:superfamily II DNA or RNA helicase